MTTRETFIFFSKVSYKIDTYEIEDGLQFDAHYIVRPELISAAIRQPY